MDGVDGGWMGGWMGWRDGGKEGVSRSMDGLIDVYTRTRDAVCSIPEGVGVRSERGNRDGSVSGRLRVV